MQNKETMIKRLNSQFPKFIAMLGGRIVDFDTDKTACTFEFNVGKDFCHSIDIVQGGLLPPCLMLLRAMPRLSATKKLPGSRHLK